MSRTHAKIVSTQVISLNKLQRPVHGLLVQYNLKNFVVVGGGGWGSDGPQDISKYNTKNADNTLTSCGHPQRKAKKSAGMLSSPLLIRLLHLFPLRLFLKTLIP